MTSSYGALITGDRARREEILEQIKALRENNGELWNEYIRLTDLPKNFQDYIIAVRRANNELTMSVVDQAFNLNPHDAMVVRDKMAENDYKIWELTKKL